MLLALILSLLAAFICHKLIKWQRKMEVGDKFPGPKAIGPGIGNTQLYFLNTQDAYDRLINWSKIYGRIYRVWFLTDLWLFVSEPKEVEKILTKQQGITKSDDYDFIHPWLGHGLLTSEGAKWFSHRKAITPAFHFQILEQFVSVFDSQSDILIEKLEKMSKFGPVNIFPQLAMMTLDVISEAAMGVTINAQLNEEADYCRSVKVISEAINVKIFSPLYRIPFIYKFTKLAKEEAEALRMVHEFVENVIQKRREQLVTNEEKLEEVDDDTFKKKKKALMDVLLHATIDNQPLTDKEIRDEVHTFMFAGHDTTSTALSFILYNLARFPDIQEKVYEEIESICGKNTMSKLNHNILNEFKYLELVIKESLRMHPPVPFIGRQVWEEIEIDGKKVPYNSNVTIAVYAMNHDDEFFPEPDKFIPERHIGESELHAFTYIPFSAGHRNCIGQKFALLETKSTLIKIIQRFKITVPDGFVPEVYSELVLKSRNGILLNLTPRN